MSHATGLRDARKAASDRLHRHSDGLRAGPKPARISKLIPAQPEPTPADPTHRVPGAAPAGLSPAPPVVAAHDPRPAEDIPDREPVCATQPGVPGSLEDKQLFDDIEANLHQVVAAGFMTTALTLGTDAATNKPLVWGAVRSALTWSCATLDIDKECSADIEKAFSSWSSKCNVVFKKVESGKGFITVRWATDDEERAGEGVIAAAFFPGEPDRSIKLYKLFQSYGAFRVAVLRHEIGHALGFRHEHIWYSDNPTGEKPTEGDMGAKLVTKVDHDSIMGYPKLWADMKANKVSDLSRLDIIGSRLVYGTPGSAVHFLL